MKQIEVQIMQQSYLLGCPEGHESRLLDAVERVDTAMTRIRDAGKVRARERIAVLAALNLAFEIADKELAALNPPVTANVPTPGVDSTQASLLPNDERVDGLLQRLDEALGDDGRLI
ncbi:MAG: cell division protein ZapA [Comamonadaceae bacterium]|nr:MAG: cell division protein ZapA [Comamonadaceae bacterium]